jgi:hypothetical protein
LIQILRINVGIAGPQRLAVAKPAPVNRPRAAQTASNLALNGANAAVRTAKSGDLGVPALYRTLTLSRGSEKSGDEAGLCKPVFGGRSLEVGLGKRRTPVHA